MQNTVTFLQIDEANQGQRLDNFLVSRLKGVPKSRIYRAIRKGEVRVNKKRVKAEYKLQAQDTVRIPPVRVAERIEKPRVLDKTRHRIESAIIYEDKQLVLINKPIGMAVHGGSGIRHGVIEALREIRPQCKFLELAHRLDRDTSGLLVIAKKSSILKELHRIFKEKSIDKRYLALVHGAVRFTKTTVDHPLQIGHLSSGERIVRIHKHGKSAVSHFRRLAVLGNVSLVEVKPLTGRTHQIRVHAQALGHPIVGDDKYGDKKADKAVWSRFNKRMYLHCASLSFALGEEGESIAVCAMLDKAFNEVIRAV